MRGVRPRLGVAIISSLMGIALVAASAGTASAETPACAAALRPADALSPECPAGDTEPSLAPASRADPVARDRAPAALVSLARPIRFQSQLDESAPAGWEGEGTPFCAAAASIMVLADFGRVLDVRDPLARTFRIGRSGNSTDDPGIDPDGVAHLMRIHSGDGAIHVHRSRWTFIDDVIGRLNHGVPVVAFTTAGDHAVTVFGYEAVNGGDVTALLAADPLSGYVGPVPIEEWFGAPVWMGQLFAAAGGRWQGAYVFVAYRDFR